MTHLEKPTAGQQRVLDVIVEFGRTRGRMPVYREIMEQLGMRSTHGLAVHLDQLEIKGWIDRENVGQGRVIHLTRAARGLPLIDLQEVTDDDSNA